MRIFLDANILFAASLPKSQTETFFKEFQRYAVLLTNPYALEEARRNLTNKKPKALPHFEQLIKHIKMIDAALTSVEVELSSKDVPILGGAVAGKVTHLLTGDIRDFGVLWGKTIRGVKIVSPQLLMDELVRKGWLQKKKS